MRGHTNNPNGRPKGTRNKRTKQWEALADSIIEEQAGHFMEYMDTLWKGDDKDRATAAHLYIKCLEYFKPKMARVTHQLPEEDSMRTIMFVDATCHCSDEELVEHARNKQKAKQATAQPL